MGTVGWVGGMMTEVADFTGKLGLVRFKNLDTGRTKMTRVSRYLVNSRAAAWCAVCSSEDRLAECNQPCPCQRRWWQCDE